MLAVIPNGLAAIRATFGDCDDPEFETRHLVSFDLPYTLIYDGKSRIDRTRAHRLAVPHFVAAFHAVKEAGLADQFRNFGGIYNKRAQRGNASRASTHSWGIAVDMEPVQFPRGSAKRLDPRIVECFTRFGFVYGGDFDGTKDPMHFQLASGY